MELEHIHRLHQDHIPRLEALTYLFIVLMQIQMDIITLQHPQQIVQELAQFLLDSLQQLQETGSITNE